MQDHVEALLYKPLNIWNQMNQETKNEAYRFCEDYISFLNAAKTEREAVDVMVAALKREGFQSFEKIISGEIKPVPGLKIYSVNRKKALTAAVLGKQPPACGFRMLGAHLDSPRLDFKPNPLYEENGLALAKTHYYGGIKKYQWVAIPLSIHGVVIKKDGTSVTISIGEKESDPVFTITDLLPHLAGDQMRKEANAFIPAENLNIVMGSIPYAGDEEGLSGSLKLTVLEMLYTQYGICERDFVSAEIEVVPAFPARDIGIDRSMIGGYGQDDRVCAYTAMRALTDMREIPEYTAVCYFSDKEEIGSVGITGARSRSFENFIIELCYAYDPETPELTARRCLSASRFLSADVTAAYDPTFGDVSEKNNAAYFGRGIALEKYTGSRGKSGASDADAELVYEITSLFDQHQIPWQMSELGKTDQGGGGTIAQYMADLNIAVLDCGVPVLSMHAPFELTSKADVYWTYQAYLRFIKG